MADNKIVYSVPKQHPNVVYVTCDGPSTVVQIRACLEQFALKLKDVTFLTHIYGRPVTRADIIECWYYINNPERTVEVQNGDKTDTMKVPMPYYFIWCSDARVAHLLRGRNLDGSERIKITEPEPVEEPPMTLDWTTIDASTSWADIAEQEEALTGSREPVVEVLPPLFAPLSFELTDKQKEDNPAAQAISTLKIGWAEIYNRDSTKSTNVLKFFTQTPIAGLKKFLAQFVSDSKTEYARYYDGKVRPDTFPFVELCPAPRGSYFKVTCDPTTDDGEFMHMMLRYATRVPIASGSVVHTYNISCTFAPISDRSKDRYEVFVHRPPRSNSRSNRDNRELEPRSDRPARLERPKPQQSLDDWTSVAKKVKPKTRESTAQMVTGVTNRFSQLACE